MTETCSYLNVEFMYYISIKSSVQCSSINNKFRFCAILYKHLNNNKIHKQLNDIYT